MSSHIRVILLCDGPIIVSGPSDLRDEFGKSVELKAGPVALCRCGRSENKPFCDGKHTSEALPLPGGEIFSIFDNEEGSPFAPDDAED